MELKAIDILNKFEALSKLADKETDLSTACIIAKNLKELVVYKDEICKKRDNLIIRYAEKNEDGGIAQTEDGGVKVTDIASFNKELSELLDTIIEVEISKLQKNKLLEIKVTAKDILPLVDILE